MVTYFVSCELNNEFAQDEFFSMLESLGELKQFSSSAWFLVTDKTAKEIRDSLSSCMIDSERLMVMKSGSPAAWKNAVVENKWILDNISNRH